MKEIKKPERRGRGRPATGKNPIIAIRWPKHLFDAIGHYAQSRSMDRAEALRQIVAKFLSREGIIPKPSKKNSERIAA